MMIKFITHHISRLPKAFKYALQGLYVAIKQHAAIQIECLCCLILIPLACILNVSPTQKIMLISSLLFVIIIELLNSAIEITLDRISTQHNELTGKAKDIAGAAVLVSLLNAAITWTIILLN